MPNYCGSCDRSFGGTVAFDRHRTGSFARDTRRCRSDRELARLGLINRDGVWRQQEVLPSPNAWATVGQAGQVGWRFPRVGSRSHRVTGEDQAGTAEGRNLALRGCEGQQ